jgi:hypothetical protein
VTQVSGACNFCGSTLNLNHRGHRGHTEDFVLN